MTGRMKPHAEGLTCEQGFQTGLKPDYAEMRETGQNPCKPPKNPTRKREEKPKIRVTAKKLWFYGRLEREKKERERRKYARSYIYNKKETGALSR